MSIKDEFTRDDHHPKTFEMRLTVAHHECPRRISSRQTPVMVQMATDSTNRFSYFKCPKCGIVVAIRAEQAEEVSDRVITTDES